MRKVQVQLELPQELARWIDPSGCKLAQRVLEALVVHLVQQDEISSGKGAELLNMPKENFRRLLREHGVPYFKLTREELSAEIEASRLAEVDRRS
jgi:predicted HTH domain antitoxin